MNDTKQTEREAFHAGYQAGYENGKRDAARHGEWLENGADYKCSECGNTESYYSDAYCRVCGAKMDGKESGDERN